MWAIDYCVVNRTKKLGLKLKQWQKKIWVTLWLIITIDIINEEP